jgi:hypothetical protein
MTIDRRATRLRSSAGVGAAMVALAVIAGCGGTLTGASADGGKPPPDGTIARAMPTAGAQGGREAGDGLEDATTAFLPGDGSTSAPGTGAENCPSGSTTSISGTVYDPAGVNALMNALVYVPSDPQAPLPPLAAGTVSCSDSCNPLLDTVTASSYVALTVTGTDGTFTLSGAPAAKNVPVVIQIGKWRREITVDTVDCAKTAIPASLSRLPRNQSEGDIPQMALVTGACDELACFMRDIGLDASEFTGPAGGGRLHVYKGAGPGPDLAGGGAGPAGDCSVAACPLWSTKAALEKYDLVLLGCECGEHNETKPDMGPMHDWLSEGGRVLATHYQDTWFRNGPADFQGVASWLPSETDGPTAGPFQVNTSWLQGNDFRAWLKDVGALNADGTLPLPPADVSSSVSSASLFTQPWIDDSSSSGLDPELLSFPTPIGGVPLPADAAPGSGPSYCGRAMFTDVHAGGGGVSSTSPVPASCAGGNMSAEEKALEGVFFDLSGPCFVPGPNKVAPPPL